MAYVLENYLMTISLVDAGENTGTVTLQLQATDDLAAGTDAGAIIAAFNAVSDGAVSTYTISKRFYNDAFALPAAGVQVEAKALLSMRDAVNPQKKHVSRIPAPKAAIFTAPTGAGSNVVDTTNLAVLAWVNLFNAASKAYVSDGETTALDGIISGRRVTHYSSRG